VKKLLKILGLIQGARHGYGAYGHKPWKKRKRYAYGPYDHPSHGYGGRRPKGLKGLLVEAILHRLLRR
jgi:hypothetical protein